jgi:hypothetical protein
MCLAWISVQLVEDITEALWAHPRELGHGVEPEPEDLIYAKIEAWQDPVFAVCPAAPLISLGRWT